METTTKSYTVPYWLSFGPSTGPGATPPLVPGRGEAGWTMARFDTADVALRFMDAHRASAMPCWPRLRVELVRATTP